MVNVSLLLLKLPRLWPRQLHQLLMLTLMMLTLTLTLTLMLMSQLRKNLSPWTTPLHHTGVMGAKACSRILSPAPLAFSPTLTRVPDVHVTTCKARHKPAPVKRQGVHLGRSQDAPNCKREVR